MNKGKEVRVVGGDGRSLSEEEEEEEMEKEKEQEEEEKEEEEEKWRGEGKVEGEERYDGRPAWRLVPRFATFAALAMSR